MMLLQRTCALQQKRMGITQRTFCFTVGKFNPIKILTCVVPSPDAKVQGCSRCPGPKVTRLSIPGPIQRCSEISLWVGTFHEIVSWKIFIPANTKTKINKQKQTNKQTNKHTNKQTNSPAIGHRYLDAKLSKNDGLENVSPFSYG